MPQSLFVKALILAGVALLLCVCLMRIGWVVDERQGFQREAVASVAQSQADAQTLLGPMLLRHCVERWTEVSGEGKDRKLINQQRDIDLQSLPAQLEVNGTLQQEARYRGLFKVNGYAGQLRLAAAWADLQALQTKAEHEGGRLECEEPRVMLADSDVRGLRSARLIANDGALTVRPGTTHSAYPKGLHAVIAAPAYATPLRLQLDLELSGAQSFSLVPAAASTTLKINSNWPHPSFFGRFLPSTRTITEEGFSAQWQVSELASSALREVLEGKLVPGLGGVGNEPVDKLELSLIDPVNPYVMSDRAIKYGLLFIVLTFLSVGLVELLAGARVHPVQYLLVGLAQSLFFLLLLSLSEHLDFFIAYAIAAGSLVGLLTYYGAAVLGGWRAGAMFGAGIALLYGTLYVLLTLEQASLLVGSVLLFGGLALVMMVTRKLDWYGLGNRAQ